MPIKNVPLELRKSPRFPCQVRWPLGWWYAVEELGFMRCQRQRVRSRACTCWALTWCVCLMTGAGGGTGRSRSTHTAALSPFVWAANIYQHTDKHMHTDGTTPKQQKLQVLKTLILEIKCNVKKKKKKLRGLFYDNESYQMKIWDKIMWEEETIKWEEAQKTNQLLQWSIIQCSYHHDAWIEKYFNIKCMNILPRLNINYYGL